MGDTRQMIDSQIGKVKFGQRLRDGSKQGGVGVPFFIAYNLKDSANHEKARTLLHQDEFFKLVFSPPPMVSYNIARKLSNYLVRGKP